MDQSARIKHKDEGCGKKCIHLLNKIRSCSIMKVNEYKFFILDISFLSSSLIDLMLSAIFNERRSFGNNIKMIHFIEKGFSNIDNCISLQSIR